MAKFSPYLLFDGTCAEAMTFYQRCVGGDLVIVRVGDSPVKDQHPASLHDRVVNARLTRGAAELSASDWLHPTRRPRPGNTVAVYLSGCTYNELRTVFAGLSEGADPDLLDELRPMPFGTYGALTDKFGVRWMFQGDAVPQ
ncbi:VOC family protein [Actinospica sp. MGRD01-02]|uniref:VOC family protein n=1 Tax=Actinospica acidithermotolerans TaxID=2828514 RepID=A0A941EH02_9ACTN|nr:VOC family protein [Actinospica acidithermotolerans]MBR7830332.1 VOC family protein [Actinospica acidithermotolerans]